MPHLPNFPNLSIFRLAEAEYLRKCPTAGSLERADPTSRGMVLFRDLGMQIDLPAEVTAHHVFH